MVGSRRTITRDSVLRSVAPAATPPPPAPEPEIAAATRQTAVWLGEAEVDWLDDQCRVIRRSGWRGVTRSALIRALLQAAMEGRLELSGVRDEQELTRRLAADAGRRR